MSHCIKEYQAIEEIKNGKSLDDFYGHTKNMAMIAVKTNPRNLAYVQNSLLTEELCLLAIAKEPISVLFVPEDHPARLICWRLALLLDASFLHYIVQKGFDTRLFRRGEFESLALSSVIQNSNHLQFISKNTDTYQKLVDELLETKKQKLH